MQHVLVATRGWCCLVEGPTADRLAPLCPCAQTQPPATQQIHSLLWAQHLARVSQGSAESLCALLTPQESSSAAALLAPRLCTGTSVVQMQLTGVGKGSSCPGKEAVPHEALASHSSGKAEVQNPASPPPMAQVLLRCGCGSCDPHILQHLGLGTKESVFHYSNPDPAEPHRIPSAALCQGPSDINTDIQHGICLEDLCPGLRQAGICRASCEVDASQGCTSELKLCRTCLGLHFLPSFL